MSSCLWCVFRRKKWDIEIGYVSPSVYLREVGGHVTENRTKENNKVHSLTIK
jgi:hypothetical protein